MASFKLFTINVIILLLVSSLSLLVNPNFSPSPSPTPKKQTSFKAPLIHRTSPESPFYNPYASSDELMREDIHIAQQRSLYFSQAMRGDMAMKIAKAPISNQFVMPINIGTPPLQTFVIADTGSSIIWVQCYPCKRCFKQDPPKYKPRASSTYKEVFCVDFDCSSREAQLQGYRCREDGVCSYRMQYGDGSFSEGTVAAETFTLEATSFPGNITLESVHFGCADNNNFTSGLKVAGIMGLGTDKGSLVVQGRYPCFSYCVIKNSSGTMGWIYFGVQSHLLGSSTPLMTSEYDNFYHLSLTGISVDDEAITLSINFFDRGFIIDSGSSHTLLFTEGYDALKDEVEDYIWHEEGVSAEKLGDLELCYAEHYDSPDITFNFEGYSFRISNENTWERQGGFYCLAIHRTADMSVFGMYQQTNVNVGYDLENNQLRLQYVNSCPEDDEDMR